ncbi:NAD(P)-dependent oxidoreductase [Phaeacidiphilus oryzae]|uniref:NAD(P)-dependent oxidoreductase n=1 Tax=Phaeacidiphilus oryzae TaxID=348818 RepID=UPI0009FDAC9D|nr:NAD(P)-dependent oxidoreductase [Phaeacidiphilus oryzae]
MDAGASAKGAAVGFVGAGRMGRPMIRRLAAAGHTVTVLASSDERRRELDAEGLAATAEVRDLGAAEAVVVCVLTDAQLREVCLDGGLLPAMAPGSLLILHTACSPATVERIAERAAPYGIDVVDTGVSGGPRDVEAGRLTLMVGGGEDAVERARPLLEAYGDPLVPVGRLGNGQRVKLLDNAVFAANIGLLAQAAAVGERLGVPEPTLLRALSHGSGASCAVAGVARAGATAGFAAAEGEFLGKDLAVVRRVAAELDVDLGALADAHRVLEGLLRPEERSDRGVRTARPAQPEVPSQSEVPS